MTAINLGRESPTRLGATYPPTQRIYLNVGLFGIAARRDCPFHPAFKLPCMPTRLCCSDPHLTVERCYLLRCPVQSGRSSSAGFPPQRFLNRCLLRVAPAAVWRASRADYRRLLRPCRPYSQRFSRTRPSMPSKSLLLHVTSVS